MNLYNIWLSLSEMSDKKYWPFSWYSFFLDVPVKCFSQSKLLQSSLTENVSLYIIFSNCLSVWLSQVDVHVAEMYGKNQAVS